MKFLYALLVLVLMVHSRIAIADGYGYLEKIENNHKTATLFILNTDPHPGQVYIANAAGDETEHDGWEIIHIQPQKKITHFNNYLVPYQRFGGKIYLWLKDEKANIINAAWIQEIDGYITFSGDTQVHSKNLLFIKDLSNPTAYITNCSRPDKDGALVCKWLRQDVNQQFTLEIKEDGTFELTRYAETPVSKKCALGDINCAFKAAASFIEDTGNKIGDAFKDFGGNIKDGFDKLGSCMEVATLGTELAAKIAAKETVLSGKLTDAILEAAQESAVQPLIGARKAAEKVLEAAQGVLDASKAAATGSIDVASKTATGTLKAGEAAATGVLTASDEAIKAVLNTFDIKQIRYEGRLQELASGKLGNVQCKATLVGKNVNFDFDLNVKDPIDALKNLANSIADKIVDFAKSSANILKRTENDLFIHDDMIKLTLLKHTKNYMPLTLALN